MCMSTCMNVREWCMLAHWVFVLQKDLRFIRAINYNHYHKERNILFKTKTNKTRCAGETVRSVRKRYGICLPQQHSMSGQRNQPGPVPDQQLGQHLLLLFPLLRRRRQLPWTQRYEHQPEITLPLISANTQLHIYPTQVRASTRHQSTVYIREHAGTSIYPTLVYLFFIATDLWNKKKCGRGRWGVEGGGGGWLGKREREREREREVCFAFTIEVWQQTLGQNAAAEEE